MLSACCRHVGHSISESRELGGGAGHPQREIQQAQRYLRSQRKLRYCRHGEAATEFIMQYCDYLSSLMYAMQKDVPGANGSPNSIVLQGQWQAAIVKEDSTWYCEDGKLVLDIRKRVEGKWNVRDPSAALHTPIKFFLADSHSLRPQRRRRSD